MTRPKDFCHLHLYPSLFLLLQQFVRTFVITFTSFNKFPDVLISCVLQGQALCFIHLCKSSTVPGTCQMSGFQLYLHIRINWRVYKQASLMGEA